MFYLPSLIEQFPLLGGRIREDTVNMWYNCRKVGVNGWSFGADNCRIIPKNFLQKNVDKFKRKIS